MYSNLDDKPLALDRLGEKHKVWLVLGLCLFNLGLVSITEDFSFFINLCGSLSGPFITFVLPGYLYTQMATQFGNEKTDKHARIAWWFMMLGGV